MEELKQYLSNIGGNNVSNDGYIYLNSYKTSSFYWYKKFIRNI